MAPKASKRAGAVTTTGAKKARVAAPPKDPVVLQCEMLAEALKAAPLPQHVIELLAAMVPRSLGVAADQRHSTQTAVVEMIESTLNDIEKKALEAVEEKKSALGVCSEELAILDKAAMTAQTAFEELASAAAGKVEELQAAAAALSESKQVVQQREDAVGKVEEDLSKASQAKEKLEAAMQQYESLKDGSLTENTQGALASITAAGKACDCDPTMLAAVPGALTKAAEARSGFENMTLGCFDGVLSARLEVLVAELTHLNGPAKAERAAALTEATATQEGAAARHEAAAQARDAAATAKTGAEAALQQAKQAALEAQPRLSGARDALHAAEAQVEMFRLGVRDIFTTLKERTTALPEPVAKVVEEPETSPVETAPVEA